MIILLVIYAFYIIIYLPITIIQRDSIFVNIICSVTVKNRPIYKTVYVKGNVDIQCCRRVCLCSVLGRLDFGESYRGIMQQSTRRPIKVCGCFVIYNFFVKCISYSHSLLKWFVCVGFGSPLRAKLRANKKINRSDTLSKRFYLVREMGLEPTRQRHTHLKRACLPIPALSHIF